MKNRNKYDVFVSFPNDLVREKKLKVCVCEMTRKMLISYILKSFGLYGTVTK